MNILGEYNIPNPPIDFILSHFDSSFGQFPRKMMTSRSNGQFTVNTKQEILKRCEQSDFKDCRINAYPETIVKEEMLIQSPNFVFVDLDLGNFDNDINKLNKVKNSTLRKMEQMHGSHPTLSWTGNGYHIYLPIDVPVLDNEYVFSKDKFPKLFSLKGKYSQYFVSEAFMQYAEDFFTSGRADPNHRPKYKTCLIRIPDTFNSKCLNRGLSLEDSKVRILQKWDGKRIDGDAITHEFLIWLIRQEINLNNSSSNRSNPTQKNRTRYLGTEESHHQNRSSIRIEWIERLLQIPIEDQRKYCLWRIIGPYLMNVKHIPEAETAKTMEKWLDQCSHLKKLDFEPKIKIYGIIKGNKGFKPISYSKLKDENKELYLFLQKKNLENNSK
ncbi:MAG: DNA primase noncatalytic subunit PriX [Candidatus Nitrosocosmicus sp.]|nr:DNA primase noncatalytic subunit PriX [Candidatus Nitrosocosmicus sp.]